MQFRDRPGVRPKQKRNLQQKNYFEGVVCSPREAYDSANEGTMRSEMGLAGPCGIRYLQTYTPLFSREDFGAASLLDDWHLQSPSCQILGRAAVGVGSRGSAAASASPSPLSPRNTSRCCGRVCSAQRDTAGAVREDSLTTKAKEVPAWARWAITSHCHGRASAGHGLS